MRDAGTPAHGDAGQKDDAFGVGTFGCEAEPVANPGKFESIRFRGGHNRRATQSGSDQAGRLRNHDDADLLRIRKIQARLKQETERYGLIAFFASKRIKLLNGCGLAPWQAIP